MLETVKRPSIDILEHIAAIFDHMASAARRPITPIMQDHILGRDARAELAALNPDFHRLGWREQQCLRREHMLNLAGADAERQSAQRAVRRRMVVSAHSGRSRQRKALLRPDDVDDTLPVGRANIFDTEPGAFFPARQAAARSPVGDGSPGLQPHRRARSSADYDPAP